jgi:hypothetical protein
MNKQAENSGMRKIVDKFLIDRKTRGKMGESEKVDRSIR